MKFYRILALNKSPQNGQCVWWGPEEKGYTTDLSKAGMIAEDWLETNRGRYDNGIYTRAIESDEALAKSHTTVSWPIS